MALIRRADSATAPRDAVVLNLGDLRAQGETLKSRANAEAAEIIRLARLDRERILEGARAEGFAKGFEEGKARGEDEGRRAGHEAALNESRSRLQQLEKAWLEQLESFARSREDLVLEAKTDVIKLALHIGKLVTKRVIEADPSLVEDQVGAVLSLVSKASRLILEVHPGDEPLVRESLPRLTAKYANDSHAEIRADHSLSPGSCVARTEGGGIIDGSVDSQLNRIADALLPGVNGSTNAGEGPA